MSVIIAKHRSGRLMVGKLVNHRAALAHSVCKYKEYRAAGSHGYKHLEEQRNKGYKEHEHSKADGNDTDSREHGEDNAVLYTDRHYVAYKRPCKSGYDENPEAVVPMLFFVSSEAPKMSAPTDSTNTTGNVSTKQMKSSFIDSDLPIISSSTPLNMNICPI